MQAEQYLRACFSIHSFFSLSSFFLNVFAETLICILNWNQTRLYKSQAFIQYIFSRSFFLPVSLLLTCSPVFFPMQNSKQLANLFFISHICFATTCKVCWRRILMTRAWWELNVWSSKRFAHHSIRQSNRSPAPALWNDDNREREINPMVRKTLV